MKTHKLLENHDRYQKLLQEAEEEGILFFNPQAPEIQKEEDEGGYKIPARYGLNSEDINGYFTPTLKEYFQGIKDQYKAGLELYSEFIRPSNTLLGKALNCLKKAGAYIKALNWIQPSIPWASWIWVVDSLATIPHDIIREQDREKKGRYIHNPEEYQKRIASVSREECIAYLDKNYVKVAEGMWVAENDPGVIVYDNSLKPYSLADGWSNDQVGEILTEWAEVMAGVKVLAVLREEIED